MAFIAPDSDIRFIWGLPLDPSYTDTLWFNDRAAQTNFFYSVAPGSAILRDYTYVRTERNLLKVPMNAIDAAKCTYMMFRNTAFGNKWFYAFVLSADYIGNNTTEIRFEVDDLQTWLYDIVRRPCLIERQTVYNDTIGHNLASENIALGPIICQEMTALENPYSYDAVVAYVDRSSN